MQDWFLDTDDVYTDYACEFISYDCIIMTAYD